MEKDYEARAKDPHWENGIESKHIITESHT
jgi:hypothetical protein